MIPEALPADSLTCPCPEHEIRRPEHPRPAPVLPGQTRGMEALAFGLSMDEPRFNITVTGAPGSGKTSTVQQVVEERAALQPRSQDICLHQNFTDPLKPKVIYLPPGGGRRLNKLIEDLLSLLDKQIPKMLEQPSVKAHMQEVQTHYEEEEQKLSAQMEELASERGIAVQSTPQGVNLIPLLDGRPMKEEEYFALDREQRQAIEDKRKELLQHMGEINPKILTLEKQKREELENYIEDQVRDVVRSYMAEMRRLIKESTELTEYLDALEAEITEKRFLFLSESLSTTPFGSAQLQVMRQQFRESCKINVLVDRSGESSAPVVLELNPTYSNLIGGVDYTEEKGVLKTDFSQIRAGGLIQANGGYLILQAVDLVQQPLAYSALKRALRSGKVQIQDPLQEMGWRSVSHMEPEAIEIRTRVVLVGNEDLIHLIRQVDDEFARLFKISADFSGTLVRSDEVLDQYVEFLDSQARKNGLLPLTNGALARLIEESSRVVGHQGRLSAQMTELSDILIEANQFAKASDTQEISRESVAKALEHRRFRHNKIEEVVKREISEGTILLDFSGYKVGQVNGLAVYQAGRVSFGVPARITAQAYAGRTGIINIEREAELSGRIHTKGVLILNGYLGKLFARKRPLALSISVTFEQNYGGIEGDSATCAEFFVILSAISGVPLNQAIAVTGSMNQHGQAQPIGGVNEKIMGFYEFAKEQGFPEGCGVIIPAQNAVNLMLPEEIVEAVREGKFRVYPITRVEDGLELMTGMSIGEADERGEFPADTLFGKAQAQLKTFSPSDKGKSKDDSEESDT